MKRISLTFIMLLLLISFSSAIKISPTQTYISMNQYGTNCTEVWILPHEDFTIHSKWTFDGKGELEKYNLSKEKIKMIINYTYSSDGKYEFCFTPNRAGNVSGIIYFYSEKTMVEIGTWIDLDVKEVGTIERISLITGDAVKNYEINEMNLGLGLIFILLIAIFYLVIKKFKILTA